MCHFLIKPRDLNVHKFVVTRFQELNNYLGEFPQDSKKNRNQITVPLQRDEKISSSTISCQQSGIRW